MPTIVLFSNLQNLNELLPILFFKSICLRGGSSSLFYLISILLFLGNRFIYIYLGIFRLLVSNTSFTPILMFCPAHSPSLLVNNELFIMNKSRSTHGSRTDKREGEQELP